MFSLHLVLWDICQNVIINHILWACALRRELFLGDKTPFQTKNGFARQTKSIFKRKKALRGQQDQFSNEKRLCAANKTNFQMKKDFVPKTKRFFKRKKTLSRQQDKYPNVSFLKF
jgi:hypothetical protein